MEILISLKNNIDLSGLINEYEKVKIKYTIHEPKVISLAKSSNDKMIDSLYSILNK